MIQALDKQPIDVVREDYLYTYLKQLMKDPDNSWDDEKFPDVVRSFFTVICYKYCLNADTMIVDNLLYDLYKTYGFGQIDMSIDDFEIYMSKLIV